MYTCIYYTYLSHLNHYTDDELLRLLKLGNEDAFDELYDRHSPTVRSLAYSKLTSIEAAREIVQNTFMHLWERRESLEIRALPNYLAVAVRYEVINHIKKQAHIQKYVDYCQSLENLIHDEAARDAELASLYEAIEQSLLRLPEKTQLIFKLSRVEYKSIAEIASLLNLSKQAIKYHITQSLKRLKSDLKEYIASITVLLLAYF